MASGPGPTGRPGMTAKTYITSMQWTDEGIVLGVKRHGETSVILELMTLERGRHLGLVRGGAGTRLRGVLQPGNSLLATWRARLDDHLGNYAVEGTNLRAAGFLTAAHAVHGVHSSGGFVPAACRARAARRHPSRARNHPRRARQSCRGRANGRAIRAGLSCRAWFRSRPFILRRDRRQERSDLCLAAVRPRRFARGRRGLSG